MKTISNARQEGATRCSTLRMVYLPAPLDHPESGLSLLEPHYMLTYKDIWLRFRNYTDYLKSHAGCRNLSWDYPFENLQGPLKWWLTTGTWSFLGPFAEDWDARPGMTQNGQNMSPWAWHGWLTAHGHKIKANWQSMPEVYASCKHMMDLSMPYLPPYLGQQIPNSGVFPVVLSAALAPKAAPYPRFPGPLQAAPPFPKLVEHPAIRPPADNKKRTMAGREGGAPKKQMLNTRPPLLTPAASSRSTYQGARGSGHGAWGHAAVAGPPPPPPPSGDQWRQDTGSYYNAQNWGNTGSSSSSWNPAPPPPPPSETWGWQQQPYPSGPPPADASSHFSA